MSDYANGTHTETETHPCFAKRQCGMDLIYHREVTVAGPVRDIGTWELRDGLECRVCRAGDSVVVECNRGGTSGTVRSP